MPTLSDIRNRVISIVQDDNFGPEIIDSYVNEGLSTVAQLVLLPALESTGSIDTELGVTEVTIPVSWNFDRNLYSVVSTLTEENVKVYSSLALFMREYPEYRVQLEAGDVEAVTQYAGKLVYYLIPDTVDTLVCSFYQKPTLLYLDSDTPSCIPDFLHYKLLVSFASKEIFDLKEDGVDGIKTGVSLHTKNFEQGLAMLSSLALEGKSRPVPNRSSDWI